MTRRRWQCFQESGTLAGRWVACAIIASVGISGCKTGGTGTSLSWWPGTAGKDANAKLASASGSDEAVKKPSETQSPYPTTSTPESYALDGAKPALTPPSAPPATPAMVAATPPGPITYGSTPPPAAAPAVTAAAAVSAPPSSPASSGAIAAQVGSYQGWPAASGAVAQGQAPSSQVQAPSAPLQPPSSQFQSATTAVAATPAPPPVAPSEPTATGAPQERYADARFTDPSAMPAASPPPAAASRYGGADASQFGGGFGGTAAAATAATTPTTGFQPNPNLEAANPAPKAASIEPASDASAPAVVQPPASSPPPGTSPTRRPDAGYRPGGTSNYRPSQAIIDEPSEDGVRRVSFESPAR